MTGEYCSCTAVYSNPTRNSEFRGNTTPDTAYKRSNGNGGERWPCIVTARSASLRPKLRRQEPRDSRRWCPALRREKLRVVARSPCCAPCFPTVQGSNRACTVNRKQSVTSDRPLHKQAQQTPGSRFMKNPEHQGMTTAKRASRGRPPSPSHRPSTQHQHHCPDE